VIMVYGHYVISVTLNLSYWVRSICIYSVFLLACLMLLVLFSLSVDIVIMSCVIMHRYGINVDRVSVVLFVCWYIFFVMIYSVYCLSPT
jgi:hypothetical protein